jgi:type II secretory pathway component PulF
MKVSSMAGTLGVSPSAFNGKHPRDGLLPGFGGDFRRMTAQQTAQLFHELTQLARSGLPIVRSLEIMGRKPGGAIAECSRKLFHALQASGSVSEAFRAAKFSDSDAAVIEAGEATGRLEQVYEELGLYYTQLAAARRQIVAKSLYPLVILHLGIFLLAIPKAIISGGWETYWKSVLPVLFTVYLAGFVCLLGWGLVRQLVSRSAAIARVILAVPVIGGFLSDWTSWKFTSVLSLYIRAGGGLLKAVESAGFTCGNAILRVASEGALAAVRNQGAGLAEAFRSQGPLPEVLERAIEVGEHAGRLDEETSRAAEIFKTRTLERLEAFGDWTPKILYITIVFYTGWQIIQMATGVAASMGQVLDIGS